MGPGEAQGSQWTGFGNYASPTDTNTPEDVATKEKWTLQTRPATQPTPQGKLTLPQKLSKCRMLLLEAMNLFTETEMNQGDQEEAQPETEETEEFIVTFEESTEFNFYRDCLGQTSKTDKAGTVEEWKGFKNTTVDTRGQSLVRKMLATLRHEAPRIMVMHDYWTPLTTVVQSLGLQ